MFFLITKAKSNTIIAIIFLLAFFVFSQISLVSLAQAVTPGGTDALNGLKTTAGKGYNNKVDGDVSGVHSDIPSLIGTIIGALLAFVGVAFLILMIYGGFIWMFARGNEQEIEKAKNLITSAIIGLVIVLSAYAATYYIGQALTKAPS